MARIVFISIIMCLLLPVSRLKTTKALKQIKPFRFHLHMFTANSGLDEDYLLTVDSLIISYDSIGARNPAYSIKLRAEQRDLFYEFLKSSKLDTLRPLYQERIWSGHWTLDIDRFRN